MIWDRLDKDAVRCCRDSTSHLEALLLTVYGLGNVEIHIPDDVKVVEDAEKERPTGEERG